MEEDQILVAELRGSARARTLAAAREALRPAMRRRQKPSSYEKVPFDSVAQRDPATVAAVPMYSSALPF